MTIDPEVRLGTVVAEHNNWVVIRAHTIPSVGTNPFVVKRIEDIELA